MSIPGAAGPSRLAIVRRDEPFYMRLVLLVILAVPTVIMLLISPFASVAFGALAACLLLLRKELRVEPARGECRVLWSILRLPLRVVGRMPLAKIDVIHLVKTGFSSSDEWDDRGECAIFLAGPWRVAVWLVESDIEARRLGERIARAAWKPLRDATGESVVERAPEELGMSLGRRLRDRGCAPPPLSPPSGTRIRVRLGPETVIEFPPVEGPSWGLFLLYGVHAAFLGGALVLGGWGVGVIVGSFLLFNAARITIDWIEWHQPRQLVIGRDWIERRTAILRARRIRLLELEDIVTRGRKLELVIGARRIELPGKFRSTAESAWVAALIERAAWEHSSARGAERPTRVTLA